jgi:NADH dehydrogenase/NADH:ubiquinone oxidoreductase subunit G
MGALTLKSFPFELRGWDIEKFESIDPTDGFGSSTKVYVNKDQIVQIEPDYNSHTFNTWLTDKGRQFFDGIFGTWSLKRQNINRDLKKGSWTHIIKNIIKTIYLFDYCNNQKFKKHFFTIIFENLSNEVVSLLIIISHNYSFIRLRRAENFKTQNDLESNFQLNLAVNNIKLDTSTLCLLISTNPRYEGYYLNLNLRQRFLKGNFKCISLGSIIDLTFPISFLGSNTKILKTIIEGNNLICQDLKFSKNPLLIFNNELLKRNDGKNITEMLKILNHSSIFNKSWNGLNNLVPSLTEVGTLSADRFLPLNAQDLTNFSSLYFLNIGINNKINLNKLTELKLLNYFNSFNKNTNINKLFLDQNSNYNKNLTLYNKISFNNEKINNYYYLPNSMFYENEETFINTEGLIKKTTKLIFKKQTKNNWHILRKIFKQLKINLNNLNNKENQLIFFNLNKVNNFKNFIHFQYFATQSLNNLNFYLNIKTRSFILNKIKFKPRRSKLINTKLKYWLDDFFSGSKDEYSQNSLILANCSKILRTESTNFF